jgi:signal transduction histidine kinase
MTNIMRQYLNWKTYLAVVALLIVGASLYYTNRLASRLADEERRKVEEIGGALKILSNPTSTTDPETAKAINTMAQNKTIPLIIADDKGNIVDKINLDSTRTAQDKHYAHNQLKAYKDQHEPIVVDYGTGINYVYYGESYLLTQLRYFPYVQLGIIILFLLVVLLALNAAHRSLQNQVWVGLSKETAHQMGTPLSSMEGWLELMRDEHGQTDAIKEMQNDLDRLKLVADRFGKVGSSPSLEAENLIARLQDMVAYMQKRSPKKVLISLHTRDADVPVNISGPLFDWVMENLIRNALDAMGGEGKIDITVTNQPQQVVVDVADNGKGIPAHQVKRVFAPGFTTKKRGWGLGLSLAKRIITTYHHGQIFVKNSEVGKGTTFRIILKR